MGSDSTSRPSARTPACASSHITLESQSKNWIFIWLTLSTLRVGHSQHPPAPTPFYFVCWHLSCLLFLFCPTDTPNGPTLGAPPAEACSTFDVHFSFFCFHPLSLFFLLGSHAIFPIFMHLHLWRTHLTQKTLQILGPGPRYPSITHDGESS